MLTTEEIDWNLRSRPHCENLLASLPKSLTGEPLTESHGYKTHHACESHLRFHFVVDTIALRTQTILLVVVRVARYSLVGVNLFDMIHDSSFRLDWSGNQTSYDHCSAFVGTDSINHAVMTSADSPESLFDAIFAVKAGRALLSLVCCL
jgi:hypothetical protein